MGPFGRLVIIYFLMGVAVNIFAPAMISDTQVTLGLNETESSAAYNTSEMSVAEMSGSLPDDPSAGSGVLPGGAAILISGLWAAYESIILFLSVMTWPAIVLSGFGVIGVAIGWTFTLMFMVALMMFIRGVT